MLVVLAERLAQIVEWFKSSAGYSKLNSIKINAFDQQNKNVRHGKDLYNICINANFIFQGIVESNWKVLDWSHNQLNRNNSLISSKRTCSFPSTEVESITDLFPHLANWISSKDKVSVSFI